jgi:hypothetical protein
LKDKCDILANSLNRAILGISNKKFACVTHTQHS